MQAVSVDCTSVNKRRCVACGGGPLCAVVRSRHKSSLSFDDVAEGEGQTHMIHV